MTPAEEWARRFDISVEAVVPPVQGYWQPYARSERQIAVRAIILQGVVAVSHEVEAGPIIDWFHDQRIWDDVTPKERAFLRSESHVEQDRITFSWHAEAEWALLWMIGKVEALGLPTSTCDTARLVDEIMPA